MAHPTYKTCAVVLRKTKLREKDLIVTLVDERGSLVRAVAKGARKPGGSLAAKLELFSTVDLMLARGRDLDIITDARLHGDAVAFDLNIEQATCASCVAELLAHIAQEGLEQEALFHMGRSAFSALAAAKPEGAVALTAAALVKLVSVAGYKPQLESCVGCASPLEVAPGLNVSFSPAEGGYACRFCPRPADALAVESETLRWCSYLLRARFADVPGSGIDVGRSFSVLELERAWIKAHLGRTLRSLEFLFACGLF